MHLLLQTHRTGLAAKHRVSALHEPARPHLRMHSCPFSSCSLTHKLPTHTQVQLHTPLHQRLQHPVESRALLSRVASCCPDLHLCFFCLTFQAWLSASDATTVQRALELCCGCAGQQLPHAASAGHRCCGQHLQHSLHSSRCRSLNCPEPAHSISAGPAGPPAGPLACPRAPGPHLSQRAALSAGLLRFVAPWRILLAAAPS